MDQTVSLTLKEKNKIIRIGKANDFMNRHMGKVVLPPVILGSALIILHIFWEETAVMLWGMGFLFGGFSIPLIWFASLSIWASRSKNYSYDLYQHLVKEYSPNESPSFRPIQDAQQEMPMTRKIANEMFDGNVEKAIDYIMKNIRGDELNAFIEEWGPEQAAQAIDVIYNAGKEAMGEKTLNKYMKAQIALGELGITEEEVLSMPNPFKKKLWTRVIILASACVGVPLLLAACEGLFADPETVHDWVLLGLGCFTTIQATGIAEMIGKTAKFAKTKKAILEVNVMETTK